MLSSHILLSLLNGKYISYCLAKKNFYLQTLQIKFSFINSLCCLVIFVNDCASTKWIIGNPHVVFILNSVRKISSLIFFKINIRKIINKITVVSERKWISFMDTASIDSS